VELVGVVDSVYSKAQELASRVHTEPFHNYRDLCDKVQAVSVVVPTPLHYSIAKDCLEHDIHVLLEKPMTSTLQEAEELIAIARKRNLTLQVGHLERFNPAYLAVESSVNTPRFIESHRLNSFQERGTDVDHPGYNDP
jgi:predicted dehydrogenase